jgi:RNA 2',3'-cyclic 3'-phosphodiesterase
VTAGPIRTFVALRFDDESLGRLTEIQDRLLRSGLGASRTIRPMPRSSLHLTMAFLGPTEEALVSPIVALVQRAACQMGRVTTRSTQAHFLPTLRHARVIALGLSDDESRITRTATSLQNELRSLGFVFESRPFLPHVTLFRARQPSSFLGAKSFELPPIELTAADLVYYRSDLEASGAVYVELGHGQTGGEAP